VCRRILNSGPLDTLVQTETINQIILIRIIPYFSLAQNRLVLTEQAPVKRSGGRSKRDRIAPPVLTRI
jgi:hypothetical protein